MRSRFASIKSAGGQVEQPSEVNNSTRTGIAVLLSGVAACRLSAPAKTTGHSIQHKTQHKTMMDTANKVALTRPEENLIVTSQPLGCSLISPQTSQTSSA